MFLCDVSPCFNCEKRHTACHITCEEYKNWKADHEKRRAEIKAREWVAEQIKASKIEFSERHWRKIHKKRK